MECIFLGVMGSFLWYRNYVCKSILVYYGVFGYILRFEKFKKWHRYEVYSNALSNENLVFGGVVRECAGILKVSFDFRFGFGVCG